MLKHLQSREDFDQKSLGAKGFTLVELLVVIVILGILAAVVVFAVSGISDRGEESACRTDLRTLRAAAEAYYAENGTYPTNEAAMVPGFLAEESDLYNYTRAGTSPNFTPSFAETSTGGCPAP